MAILNKDDLHRLASLAGIDASVAVARDGNQEKTVLETERDLLVAMDILTPQGDKSDQEYAQEINKVLNKTLDAQYASPVAPVCVLRQNRQKEVQFVVPVGHEGEELKWNVNEENGNKQSGSVKMSDTHVVKDAQGRPMTREINGVTYEKRAFTMPADFEIGYHQLEMEIPGQPKTSTRMIYAPTKCYDPIDIAHGGKTWGVPVQLYEQMSDENQGIGDFSDLAEIADTLGKSGAGIVGVNPLHAMFPNAPEEASPYSPASRTYFNHVYVDVTAVPEFEQSKAATELYDSAEYTEKRRKAQRVRDVDYTAAFDLKTPVLELCYDEFQKNASPERKAKFEEFKKEGGERMKDFAVFQTLSEHFSKQEPPLLDWRDWPAEYQDSKTPEVKAFAEKNADRVGFYEYLQFETLRQMENVQQVCKDNGMKVGLYTDIAVGSAPYGFEGWGCKDLYMKASAGACADILSSNGQNWNVMGFKPQALQNSGYEPFIEMLRNNMKTAGCTRLDHVLQLQRLYMIPDGKPTNEGGFVYYPVDDLMAIAALESHRNKCMLIGEDLGCLPDGFRPKLEDHGILSYRVLPFERQWGFQHGDMADNAFNHPENYPVYSTAAPSTHDTPSLSSQWTARDVHLKDYLGFYTSEQQRNMEFCQYETQRCALQWALCEKGCYDRVGGKPSSDPAHDTRSCPEKYEQAVADFLGQSSSAMLLFPFSDMFRTSYMGNIPGTRQFSTSHTGGKDTKVFEEGGASKMPWKNWRPKMHWKVNEIKELPVFQDIAGILNGYRQAGNDHAKEKTAEIPEFKRPGRTETKRRDPKHAIQIWEKLAEDGYFKTHAYDIIAAKFSDKRRQRDMQKTEEFKKQYEERRAAIEEHKKQYKQKPSTQPKNMAVQKKIHAQKGRG